MQNTNAPLIGYAGSPSDYDTPSVERIGSGEGQQTQGWGLYFSLNPKDAFRYRDNYAKPTIQYGDEFFAVKWDFDYQFISQNGKRIPQNTQLYYLFTLLAEYKDSNIVIQYAERDPELAKYKTDLISGRIKINSGVVVKAELPSPEFLLDRNLLLSKQSEFVKTTISNFIKNDGLKVKDITGGRFYDGLQTVLNLSPKQCSLMLYDYGIKGLTYMGVLDGRCVVVFSDKDIKVINKFYGTYENASV